MPTRGRRSRSGSGSMAWAWHRPPPPPDSVKARIAIDPRKEGRKPRPNGVRLGSVAKAVHVVLLSNESQVNLVRPHQAPLHVNTLHSVQRVASPLCVALVTQRLPAAHTDRLQVR